MRSLLSVEKSPEIVRCKLYLKEILIKVALTCPVTFIGDRLTLSTVIIVAFSCNGPLMRIRNTIRTSRKNKQGNG